MESKIYKFDPVIYPFPLLVTKSFKVEELKDLFLVESLEDNVFVEITDELNTDGHVTARTLKVEGKADGCLYYMIVLFKPDDCGCGVCTHEAMHITNTYLGYLGFIEPKAYLDEPHAYFGQWISNCIWSVLVDEPKKMKGEIFS